MTHKMKGLCLNKEQKLELKEFPIPEPKEGYVRVKVKRAGICGSDIGYWKYGSHRLKLPVILGHEISGVVNKLGKNVTQTKIDDRVIVLTTYEVCGKCRFCKINATNLCINRRGIGSKENGGFAEYVIVPESSILKMPDSMTFEEGALVELLSCAVHGVIQQTQITPNSVTLVLGPGPIGLMVAQIAKDMGSNVLLAGLNNDFYRLQLAKKLGINNAINLQKENIKELLSNITNGYGADFIVESSGSYKALETALDLVAYKGTICQIGIHHSVGEVDWSKILFKEINIIGALSHNNISWEIARDLITKGKVKVKPLISNIMPLKNYKEAFEKASSTESLKVLFDLEK